jgi:hypothetical protein
MTTLIKYLHSRRVDLGWYCNLLKDSASELYQGTGHPEYWIAILACTRPDLVAPLLVKLLDAPTKGTIWEPQLLNLDKRDRHNTILFHDALKKQAQEDTHLINALLQTTRYILNQKPGNATAVIMALKKLAPFEGMSEEQFLSDIYATLHTEIPFDVWKGEYE